MSIGIYGNPFMERSLFSQNRCFCSTNDNNADNNAERDEEIKSLSKYNVSDEEKVYLFINKFESVTNKEFNKLAGENISSDEWEYIAGSNGMNLSEANDYFELNPSSDEPNSKEADRPKVQTGRWNVFQHIDQHKSLDRKAFNKITGHNISENDWKDIAGSDGKMGKKETKDFFAQERIEQIAPTNISNREKVMLFMEDHGPVNRKQFNELAGEYVSRQQWPEMAGNDSLMGWQEANKYFGQEPTNPDRPKVQTGRWYVFRHIDQHESLDRKTFNKITGHNISENDWKDIAGSDGKMDKKEAKDFFTQERIEQIAPTNISNKEKVMLFMEDHGPANRQQFNEMTRKYVNREQWQEITGDEHLMGWEQSEKYFGEEDEENNFF